MAGGGVDPALPAWREVVREAAREAAVAEERARRGGGRVAFCYRWEHVQAVVRLSVRLAKLTGADGEVVEAAAWLHDVAKGPGVVDHGQEGAVAARRILAGTDFPPHKIEAVAEAVARHVGLFTEEAVEPLEAAVVWDADKLSKLGATAVAHFIGYKMIKGQATTRGLVEWLPDTEWQEGVVRSLNTAPARAAGRARLETYRAFCRRLVQEYDGKDL